VAGLRALYDAIIARDADLAERFARQEVMNATAEVMRILERDDAAR
jgi:hypothetical protein